MAIDHGVPASVSALIAGRRSRIMTAFLAPALVGETNRTGAMDGRLIGFVGICPCWRRSSSDRRRSAPRGAPAYRRQFRGHDRRDGRHLHQKRYIHSGDLRSVATLQYVGALVAVLPAGRIFRDMRINWTPTAWAVLAWSVLALSIGAIALLLYLIRRGEVSRPPN